MFDEIDWTGDSRCFVTDWFLKVVNAPPPGSAVWVGLVRGSDVGALECFPKHPGRPSLTIQPVCQRYCSGYIRGRVRRIQLPFVLHIWPVREVVTLCRDQLCGKHRWVNPVQSRVQQMARSVQLSMLKVQNRCSNCAVTVVA
eukprot:EG_transcript_35959